MQSASRDSMLPSFLTAFLFALSVVCARRAAKGVGVLNANFARLILSLILLGMIAHYFGQGWDGPGFGWFFVGGVIGVGIGDLATFIALMRIGPRLTSLIVNALCAPIGALIEWYWLGTALNELQIVGSMIIIAGVAISLAPGGKGNSNHPSGSSLTWGVLLAFTAAASQAIGAVFTRKGNEMNLLDGLTVGPISSAYQRMIGAFCILFIIYLGRSAFAKRGPDAAPRVGSGAWRKTSPWIVANALAGLTFGVICFQWALKNAPAGIVLSVLATVPLIVMPITWLLDNDRPSRRAVIGGGVAVSGVLILLNSKMILATLGWG